MNDFRDYKWKDFNGELKEAIPPNDSEERGKEVDLCGYVDINLTLEKETRRSRSWFFIFMNTSLIQWFFKKQATI